jgi:septal ring factor EnvC (AmiA/AmiB activator)
MLILGFNVQMEFPRGEIMARDERSDTAPIPSDQSHPRRKKLAKKEARAMLDIEEAKASLAKAQSKRAKAQARVEACATHLYTLEAKLTMERTPSPEANVEVPASGFSHQQNQPEP